jgi:hypothetical protein
MSRPHQSIALAIGILYSLSGCNSDTSLDAGTDLSTDLIPGGDAELALQAQQLNEPPFIVPEELQIAAALPAEGGTWSAVIEWPHIPASAAQLPDGRLLTWAAATGTLWNSNGSFTQAAIWDPVSGEFENVNNPQHNMFCAHQATLPDGRVIVNGGADLKNTSIFDPITESWIEGSFMNDSRWYPTTVAMPDGSVFTALGSTASTSYPELWMEDTGWQFLRDIDMQPTILSFTNEQRDWWPLLNLAPDGSIFHSGPTPIMHRIGLGDDFTIEPVGDRVDDWYHKHGVTVMYDEGKVLTAGGWASGVDIAAVSDAMTIDFSNASSPQVALTAPMNYRRKFHNGVVLPNGEVLVVGGNTSGRLFSDVGTQLTPEIWNPDTGTWREINPIGVPRNYHSIAVLLPDARVLSAGGGLCDCNADHPDGQILTPDYLYNDDGTLADRPVITSAPENAEVGGTISLRTSRGVAGFSMIRMSSTTHQINTDLRFLEPQFSETTPNEYQVQMHSNDNVLVPGYWMLFALDQQGTPSVSTIIHITANDLASVEVPAPVDAQPGNCGLESGLQSESSTTRISFDVENRTDKALQLYWLSFSGDREAYRELAPGERFERGSYLTHPWLLADVETGDCVALLEAPVNGDLLLAVEPQTDTDEDGIPDSEDSDDDNDGIDDVNDAFPIDPNESADTDGDGIGNNTDTDDDGDGVIDATDAFPLDPSESTDQDSDGIGDNADDDDNNNGIPDDQETDAAVENPVNPDSEASSISNEARGITLDGNLNDWALYTGFAPDPDDVEGANDPLDWLQTWMAHDGVNIYLAYRNDGVVNPSWGQTIYLDTDTDGTTGYNSGLGIGADYVLQSNVLYRYTGEGGNWSWDFVTETAAQNNGVGDFEMRFALSQLGSPATIRLALVGGNAAYPNGRLEDLYPDGVYDPTADKRYLEYNVTAVPNSAPRAGSQAVVLKENSNLAITLSAIDPDGDVLSYAISRQPSNGTLSDDAPLLTYTPNADFNGTDGFSFTASDGELTSGIGTVEITVRSESELETTSNLVTTLTLDGNLSDWSEFRSFGLDPDDVRGAENLIDWREGWVAHDEENFYFAYRNDGGDIGAIQEWTFNIAIDSDRNAATGYRNGGAIGADFLLQGGSLYRHTGAQSEWSWAFEVPAERVTNGDSAEMSVNRQAMDDVGEFDLIYFGDNASNGGNTEDLYPDGIYNSSDANRFFSYSTNGMPSVEGEPSINEALPSNSEPVSSREEIRFNAQEVPRGDNANSNESDTSIRIDGGSGPISPSWMLLMIMWPWLARHSRKLR